MLRIAVLAVCCFSSVSSAYAGPPAHTAPEPFWRPVARACAEATNEHGGFWPVWAKCTVLNVWGDAIPEDRVDRCINQVQRERERIRACNNCGDPVRDVISCLGLQ